PERTTRLAQLEAHVAESSDHELVRSALALVNWGLAGVECPLVTPVRAFAVGRSVGCSTAVGRRVLVGCGAVVRRLLLLVACGAAVGRRFLVGCSAALGRRLLLVGGRCAGRPLALRRIHVVP